MRRTWGRWTGDTIGRGVDGERLARFLDAARQAGVDLGPIKNIRVVDDVRKSGSNFRTVSEAVQDRIENEAEFIDEIFDVAKKVNAEGQKQYKQTTQPVTPEVKEKVENGSMTYKAFIRSQTRAGERIDEEFKVRKDKTQDKEKFAKEWYNKNGFTAKIAKPGALKPGWSHAANVIVKSVGPIDVPGPQDRRVITRVVENIQRELTKRGYKTTNADVQAVLWYPEKDLWAKLRGEDESNLKSSYDEQFISLAEQRGLGDEARRVAAAVVERRTGAARTGSPDVAQPAGGVLGQANRKGQAASGEGSFRLTPIETLDRLAASIERRKRDPEMRRRIYDNMLEKLEKMKVNWSFVRERAMGNINPLSEKRTSAELDKEQAMRAALSGREAAYEWRRTQDEIQSKDWDPRAVMLRHLRTLDAILSALPMEVRAKVGGWTAVASPDGVRLDRPTQLRNNSLMLSTSHLRFAQRVAHGFSQAEAYRLTYPRSSKAAANVGGTRLLKKASIRNEVGRLRRAAETLPGGTVLTLAEKRWFLARVVRARLSDLPADSDLWQEVADMQNGIKRKLPDKLRAILLDNDLAAEGSGAGVADELTRALASIVGKRPRPMNDSPSGF